ncbi:MAG: GDSL-type esterase/lipase family protein [Eubacteriales bacterium]|nr:GDSL-type esterase/lipase family protein [Eubacteriales bacterium]
MSMRMESVKKIIVSCSLIGMVCGVMPAQTVYGSSKTVSATTITYKMDAVCKREDVSKETINALFAKSAFIGNSVGVGQKMYFNSKGRGFLGNPKMLVQGCYSFSNDKSLHSQFSLQYGGRRCHAKDAIAYAKVKYVFINMGTNDLWKEADSTYLDYVEYIKGIQKRNPNVVIFIESTTPMCSSRNGRYLNNHAINRLNSLIEQYCKKHKDLYYVDITKGMRDATGGLKSAYASDGYVHMTMAGYEVWTNNLVEYVENLIAQETTAKNLVFKVKYTKHMDDYIKAKKAVDQLEKSTKKMKLVKQLKKVKKKIVY